MDRNAINEILKYGAGIYEMNIKGYSNKPVKVERLEKGFIARRAPEGSYMVVTKYSESGVPIKQWCEKVK